jgi:hypothetical protein
LNVDKVLDTNKLFAARIEINMKKNILLLVILIVFVYCKNNSENKYYIYEKIIKDVNKKYRLIKRDTIQYYKDYSGKINSLYINLHNKFDIQNELKYLYSIKYIHIDDPMLGFSLSNIPKITQKLKITSYIKHQNMKLDINLKYLDDIAILNAYTDTISIIGRGNVNKIWIHGLTLKHLMCSTGSLYNLKKLDISKPKGNKNKITMSKDCFKSLKEFYSINYIYEDWFIDYLGKNNVKVRLEDSLRVREKYTKLYK